MTDSRFKKYQAPTSQINAHFNGANKKLKSAKKLLYEDPEASYQLAYEAM